MSLNTHTTCFHIKFMLVIFNPRCLYEDTCLIYVICVCLHIAVSTTNVLCFLFCLSPSCVLCGQCCQSLWIVQFLIAASVLSNVYFPIFFASIYCIVFVFVFLFSFVFCFFFNLNFYLNFFPRVIFFPTQLRRTWLQSSCEKCPRVWLY